VNLATQDKYDRLVAWANREVTNMPIAEAIAQSRAVDPHQEIGERGGVALTYFLMRIRLLF